MQQLRQYSGIDKVIEQIKAIPKPKTEESILLRALVQTIVIIGIIATDVASRGQLLIPMSIWAIPLSIVGAVVSWRRRKEKNIGIKFGLAIAMIATLAIFLRNLLNSPYDNRLVLAEFLVQLQVIHSFDLPRRKDLGYSMVIGLILIGVAGTLSQTLAFAPFLILFLLLAIPTLILDYRSRMGLPTWETEWKKQKQNKDTKKQKEWLNDSALSPAKLGKFVVITTMLGLLLFALMPRYQGYKLQTFPVNAPEELRNRGFAQGEKGIVNPGYDSEGNGGNLMGEGEGGNGRVDDTFYYGFNTTVNQNQRGSLTNKKIVLRIRSQARGFWRALAFDHYTGKGWEISRDLQTMNLPRSYWRSNRFDVPFPNINTQTKRVIQTYTVVSDLPNIIPILNYPRYVYFPTKEIAIDPEGSLRSPAGLIEGLTYTVISQVPYRNQTELAQAGKNYPDLIKKYYVDDIPPEIKEKVRVKAEELLAKATRDIPSDYEKALFLAQAIKQNYQIIKDAPLLGEDEDLAEAFLYRDGGGMPDQFATVYTLMLRSLGIPARPVVGFAPGQFNPFTGYYVVHNTDAYTLAEAYFPQYGWFYFDPLPGNEIIPPSFQEEENFGVLKQFWDAIVGLLPNPVANFIGDFVSQMFEKFFDFLAQGWIARIWYFLTGSFLGILTAILGLILFAFLMWLTWQECLTMH